MDKEKDDWMKVVYEEAWRQYCHEDNISEQRDSKFLTILSLIFTAAGIMLSMMFSFLVELEQIGKKELLFVVGILIIIFALLLLAVRFCTHWKKLTLATNAYTKIRLEVASEIEEKAGCYKTLAQDQEKRLNKLDPNIAKFDGFASTVRIIHTIQVLTYIVLGLSVCGIALCLSLLFFL